MIQAPTGGGKSYLARHLVRQLLARSPSEAAVFVDDPKGDFYAGLEEDCAALTLENRTILFNTSHGERLVGFNPLLRNGLSPQDHALWILGAVKACWGQENFDATPQLARWLFNGTAPAIEGGGTFLDALEMLNYEKSSTRRLFIEKSTDSLVKQEWENYEKLSQTRRREETASAYARLRPFVHNPTIKQIMAPPHASLDLGRALREGKILLSHIPRYRPLDPELVSLLRSLLLHSLLAQAFHHPVGERPPLYIVLDEAEHLLERDTGAIATILNEGRSLGIHLILIFHTFAQVARKNPALLASVLANCRTKFVGGHIPQEDLRILTEEFFVEEWSPYIVKDEITGLEVEPIEETRAQISLSEGEQKSLARTAGIALGDALARGITAQVSGGIGKTDATSDVRSRGKSNSHQHTEGFREADASGASVGDVFGPDGMPLTTYHGDASSHVSDHSIADAYGTTESEAEAHGSSSAVIRSIAASIAGSLTRTNTRTTSGSVAETVGRNAQHGVTIVPFLAPRKRVRVVSRTFLGLQEFLTEKLNRLKGQRVAHWAVKPPEGRATFFRAVFVQPLLKTKERLLGFRQRVFRDPCYIAVISPPAEPLGAAFPIETPMVEFSETPPPTFREED